MGSNTKLPIIAAVIVVAFILQIVLVTADHHESPGKAAVAFSKAYFKLNEDMEKHLCHPAWRKENHAYFKKYADRACCSADTFEFFSFHFLSGFCDDRLSDIFFTSPLSIRTGDFAAKH